MTGDIDLEEAKSELAELIDEWAWDHCYWLVRHPDTFAAEVVEYAFRELLGVER